jgi:nitroreductase
MDFTELIHNRESIRDYDPERQVPLSILKKIMDAGRVAPSAANRQPWIFILISSPAYLDKVRICYPKPWFKDAPHILIVSGNPDNAWVRKQDGYNSIETDLAIAMDHMILAAENEGVGTCWIAAFDDHALHSALDLEKTYRVFAITPLGYPRKGFQKKGIKERKSLEEVTRFL